MKKLRIDLEVLKKVLLYTLLLGFAAHAYIFFNFFPSHDSTMVISVDQKWEISLGRFLQPVYLMLRGEIAAPWLIGILSLIFVALSTYCIVELLNIKNTFSILALCGVFSTNIVLMATYATYINWADIYMFALFCCCLGTYLLEKLKWGIFPAICLLVMSLGLYQSYISVAVGLMIIMIIVKALKGESFSELCFSAIKYIGCLLCSGIIYMVSLKYILSIWNIEMVDNYNGLSQLMRSDIVSFAKLIPKAYFHFFSYFFSKSSYNSTLIRLCTGILLLIGIFIWGKYFYSKRLKPINYICIFIALLLLPLGLNLTFVMATGWAHSLMLFSLMLIYILLYIPLEELHCFSRDEGDSIKILAIYKIVFLLSVILIFHNIVYSNGAYYYKNLVGRSTESHVERIINEMESNNEYVPGSTPVAIIGDFYQSSVNGVWNGFEKYNDVIGFGGTSVTYNGTFTSYCSAVLGHPVNIIWNQEEIDLIAQLDEVKEMPVYPQKGFCKMIKGIMVLRIQ